MNYPGETAPSTEQIDRLADPGLDGVSIRNDVGRRFDRIGAEQLSRPPKQCAHFVQLLLQPGISHLLKVPRPRNPHNSLRSRVPPAAFGAGQTAKVSNRTGRYAWAVAIFGRNTARQRLRRAARESLKIPAFSSPVDCTPWVTGGLWPAELSTVTAETAPLVKYLKADLQRIVNSANEELKGIRRAGLAESTRQAEEARVINGARAFAVRRVESTVRHLHSVRPKAPSEYRPVNGAADTEKTARFKIAIPPPEPRPEPTEPIVSAEPPAPEFPEPKYLSTPVLDDHDWWSTPTPFAAEPEATEPKHAEPEPAEPEEPEPPEPPEPDDTEVLAEIATVLQEIAPLAEAPVAQPVRQPPVARPSEAPVDQAPIDEPLWQPPPPAWHPVPAAPAIDDTETTRHLVPVAEGESDRDRLERLLKFVARQEPGLRWAVGIRADGTTLLVTDLAHGWIPPGITLPADVCLLEPERRTGNASALLGQITLSASYAPSDPLGWATDYDPTETSSQPRELPAVDDLGWLLSEATHWRDGLPRMVHTLAKAGAAGTGIIDAEIDILRVYLDTSRYQLLAQYPDVDAGLLLNCLLLAATEGIATGNPVSANYHFAWFQMLSAPPASGWKTGR
jgi:hypothetical protein